MCTTIPAGGYNRLTELTAGDLITGLVIVIPASATMHDAARILARERIGLAPIVNEDGYCVGVLSARDFVAYELDRTGDPITECRAPNLSSEGLAVQPCISVQRYMATAVQTVAFDIPLKRVVEMMLGGCMHHLVVLDAETKPIGVISTLDVVAAVNAMDDEHKGSSAR